MMSLVSRRLLWETGTIACLFLAVAPCGCTSPEEEARSLLNEALKFKAEGQLQEAIQKYKEVEEEFPSTAAASEALRERPVLERVWARLQSERLEVAIVELKGALDLYRFDVGRYPLETEGLKALTESPGVKAWAGPYLKKLPDGIDQLTYMSNNDFYKLYPPGTDLPPIPLSRFERTGIMKGREKLRAYLAKCRSDEDFPMLLYGRPLDAADFSDQPTVVQVNEQFARQHGVDLGAKLVLADRTLEVVGVVGDSYDCPTAYLPGQ